MVDLRPFRALRPTQGAVDRVVAHPYDVLDRAEAQRLAAGNPDSFLHVNRPDIDVPDGTPTDSTAVHAAGRDALAGLVERGVLVLDDIPSYAVYRQVRDGRAQTGVVAAASVADYVSGAIRTHEQTRPDKENDRVHHIEGIGAHDEPVFLLARPDEPTWARVAAAIAGQTGRTPDLDTSLADLTTGEPVQHTLWHITDQASVDELSAALAALPVIYVADGHHRSAAAARVAAEPDPAPGADVFPVVVFPGEELTVLPYNRVVADLADLAPEDFVRELAAAGFAAEPVTEGDDPSPARAGEVALRLPHVWYRLAASVDKQLAADPVASLDVSVLQDQVLGPVLGIGDPRTDPRIAFVGGARGADELERLVDDGSYAAAFLMHPPSVDQLVAVAGSGRDMPPKSTWFEPKLASGLFVHRFGD